MNRTLIGTGFATGRDGRAAAPAGASVLLFYASVRTPGPQPDLYAASRLLEGLHNGLAGHEVHLSGAGALTDLVFGDGWILIDDVVARHAAVAVVLPPAVASVTRIFHGCRPISSFHEITRIDGALLQELDSKPAVQVIESLVPPALLTTDRDLMLSVTIGQKIGDPFGPFEEGRYIHRLILGFDRESGAVRLLESDFVAGRSVQIMMRNPEQIFSGADSGTAAALANPFIRRPLGAIYINCAGLSNAISGFSREEAGIVCKAIGSRMPICGLYSEVGTAPLLGRPRPLDWTGALTTLAVSKAYDRA